MKHIFVIDDEVKIRDLIKLYLVKENYQVTLFEDGSNVVKEMQRLKPDLLVLDIMMPNVNGLDLCKEIRKNSEIPIIFVSAKDEEFDRVLGLELGADDYLSKPFSPRELVVRIKNIFKRIDKATLPAEIFELHDIVVNLTDRTTRKGSRELILTTKEFELFSFLIQNRNQPFTREQLLSRVWGYDYFGDERTIDDLVKRIRKKLSALILWLKFEPCGATVIRWLNSMSKIERKLIFSYFLVILIAFVTIGISFSVFSNTHLLREARQQLRKEASFMATLLKPMPLDSNAISQRIRRNHSIRLAGRLFESEIIILDSNRKLIFQNAEDFNIREFRSILNSSTPRREGFLIERAEIISPDDQLKGYVFLLIKIENITSLNKLMLNTLFTSFLIAGSIALLIGSLFGRRIAKPISHLNDTMLNFSLNNSSDSVEINTKDEISELGQSFNQMIKKIHALDEEQKRFLQNTSHELKTPLMSIQGYAEAIKDGIVTGDKVDSSLNIIIEESQRLKKTVYEIIYLTKLENANEKFSFENKDLASSIEKSIISVQSLASDKNIYIKNEVEKDTIVSIDEDKLIRVLINILGNAIRYTNKLIIINSICTSKHIELFIIDDGNGFEAGVENKIFERFYKGKDGSTGLGLTICKTIVGKHGGSISAYNKSPHGAVFKIILPLTKN